MSGISPEDFLREQEMNPPFEPFDKISRLRRPMIVTEKIDGENAGIYVGVYGTVIAARRGGWITSPSLDIHGFSRWVKEHEEELRTGLGPGMHWGEWWGKGVKKRNYGLNEKRFSLHNTGRWGDVEELDMLGHRVGELMPKRAPPPACCGVVPVLAVSNFFSTAVVSAAFEDLREKGSRAVPGYMSPEGVVVFHSQAQVFFKQTYEHDDEGKGADRG